MRRSILAVLFWCVSRQYAVAVEMPEVWTCSYAYQHSDNKYSLFTRRFDASTGIGTGDTIIERFIRNGDMLELQTDDEIPYVASSFKIIEDNQYALVAAHAVADAHHAKDTDSGGIAAVTVVIDKKHNRFTVSVIRADSLIASEERRGSCMNGS